ncbi:uncharacterized protein KY384_006322 [Bacidia gigantensis]|uniref:uncharacterized protein n=1 Tax=Bacidia gigantensis TaxID=2732470 RepID=UPI001D038F0A|nr:uncharacterized protein KY384_006322 [Bacidia gigantensis]KAG8528635.1 hypothetical protein KY384_006322 [Bacidia gigantensis]
MPLSGASQISSSSPLCPKVTLPPDTIISRVKPEHLPSYRRLIGTSLPIKYPDKFFALSTTEPIDSGTIALCAVHSPPPEPSTTNKRKEDVYSLSQGPQVIACIQARLEPIHPPSLGHKTSIGTHAASGPSSQRPHPPQPGLQPQPPCQSFKTTTQTEYDGEYAIYVQTLTTAPSHRTLSMATTLLAQLIFTALSTWSEPSPLNVSPSTSGNKITMVYAHVWESNVDALEWYQNRGFEVLPEKVEGYYRKLRPSGARVVKRGIGVRDHLQATDERRCEKGPKMTEDMEENIACGDGARDAPSRKDAGSGFESYER